MVKACWLVAKGLFWQLGNGRSIFFWDDSQFGNRPLKDEPWAQPFMDLCVRRFGRLVANYNEGGCWKKLYEVDLGLEVMFKAISLVHIPSSPSPDKFVWKPTSNGNFSVASTFHSNESFVGHAPYWASVWSSRLVPKVNIFFWIFFQNKILTTENLVKRGFVMPNRCFLCEEETENACHLLIDCRFVRMIWGHVLSLWNLSWVFPSS